MWALFILIGVLLTILNSNGVLFVPSFVEYILYGIGGLLLVGKAITALITAKAARKITRRF